MFFLVIWKGYIFNSNDLILFQDSFWEAGLQNSTCQRELWERD